MMDNTINGRTPEEIRKGQPFSEYIDEALSKVTFAQPENEGQEQKKRTPEEIKKGLELCCVGKCSECPYREECDEHLACGGDMLPADVVLNDIAALIQQLERERDADTRNFCGKSNKSAGLERNCQTSMYGGI